MEALKESPIVVAFADWVWGGEASSDVVSPEVCLQHIPLLTGGCFTGLLVKGIGVAIIVLAFLNKAPVIRNIVKSQSAVGFTQLGVYSDIILVSNCAFYGFFNQQPITAYGENVALALQSIVIGMLLWKYKDDPAVTAQQKIMATVGFVLYIICVTVFLPEEYYYLLMAFVWPLSLYSRGAIISEAFRNQHMGSNALLTYLMNFAGSSVRILTTIQEVGWDMAMLSGFFLSLVSNGIIIIQFWIYQQKTAKFLREQEEKKKA